MPPRRARCRAPHATLLCTQGDYLPALACGALLAARRRLKAADEHIGLLARRLVLFETQLPHVDRLRFFVERSLAHTTANTVTTEAADAPL